MEASYEVLGDSHSEGSVTEISDHDTDEEVNGEEIRNEMEELALSNLVRTGFTVAGFAMSVVGIWGDGA